MVRFLFIIAVQGQEEPADAHTRVCLLSVSGVSVQSNILQYI